MFKTFENLRVTNCSDAVLKEIAEAYTTCDARFYTRHCGIVILTAKDIGRICGITVADTAGGREKDLLVRVMAAEMGCPLSDAEVIHHKMFNHPHPRMQGSKRFMQCDLLRRTAP